MEKEITVYKVILDMMEEVRKTEIVKAYEAAISDAETYGAGWLMVDQSGRARHVKPADVLGWATMDKEKGK